ncbi:MAG: hypothetical protein K5873_01145 [Treponema sp.]|nr:hypothetical protein [Treponema sp.]
MGEVYVYYTPASIGDGSYSDLICYGLHKSAIEKNFFPIDVCPLTWEEAEDYVKELIDKISSINNQKNLYIFADTNYKDLLSDLKDKDLGSLSFLILDTKECQEEYLNSIYISYYGAAYLSGLATKKIHQNWIDIGLEAENNFQLLCILANNASPVILGGLDGFAEAYGVSSEEEKKAAVCPPRVYFNDEDFAELYGRDFSVMAIYDTQKEDSMYDNAAYLYNVLNYINQQNPFEFYFPLCGSSIQGILRYSREHENLYTMGADVDYSAYSSQVAFSMVKHIDTVIMKSIDYWFNGKLPHHQELGLKDNATEFIVSGRENWTEMLGDIIQNKAVAIEKEQAYEAAKTNN